MMAPPSMQRRSFSYKPVKPLLPFPEIPMEKYKNSHDFITAIKNHQPTYREVDDEKKKKELQEELKNKNWYIEVAREALKKEGTEVAFPFAMLARESKKKRKQLEEECNDRAVFKKFWQDQAVLFEKREENAKNEKNEKNKKKKN